MVRVFWGFLLAGRLIPFHLQGRQIAVGHRVVNVRAAGAVPFGLSGVVVSVLKSQAEVLFDQSFLGGSNLAGR